jgi:hypothetical protein
MEVTASLHAFFHCLISTRPESALFDFIRSSCAVRQDDNEAILLFFCFIIFFPVLFS